MTSFIADDTLLLMENEKLQKVVNECYMVCQIRKLKVNAGKCKVMVVERKYTVFCKIRAIMLCSHHKELSGRLCNAI